MKCERLLAKSIGHDGWHESMSLPVHLRDVYAAAGELIEATGREQLEALGLPPERHLGRFRRLVLLAAALHDLGKANDHFQGMVTRQRNVQMNPQGVRHEWATILMMSELRDWMLPAMSRSETDLALVEWAVAGHHRAGAPTSCPAGGGVEIEFQTAHGDFLAALEWISKLFAPTPLGDAPPLPPAPRPLVGPKNVFTQLAAWRKAAQRVWDERVSRSDDRKLAAAVKSCLIAADVAGSALPKALPTDPNRWTWIARSLATKPEPGDLQLVASHRLKGDPPRQFQAKVAASKEAVTFLKAGCGTGKTVAAYLWAAHNHPTRRLYFCYPTTGTATEGFKDYLFEPEGELGELGAKLFHSRRDVDFEIILGTGPDSQSPDADLAARLESLEAWSTPIVACTVDTVLGLVQNNKRGLYAWPALAQSAFVFDEIHSYDDRLFGALLRFLRDLPGLPALLMTASLPKVREAALRQVLSKFRGIDLKPIEGPKELEELPRYHRLQIEANDPLAAIKNELRAGGKVLWVCNTVGRVMAAADRAEAAGLDPLIYHSRFKYVDRVQRHKAVVGSFTSSQRGGVLAACSQVAEMSLDLKGCTLLVTDLAPVPPAIQRMGRLNRQAGKGDPTRPFIVVEPDGHLPYTPAELELARSWLGRLPADNISQRDLADQWEQTADQPPDLIGSAWLDGGPVTIATELREASPGVTVLMREDIPRIAKPKDIGKFALPMPPPPRKLDWRSWPKHQGMPVAEPGTIAYCAKRGAEWRK